MFGFLLKILIVVLVVVGITSGFSRRASGQLTLDSLRSELQYTVQNFSPQSFAASFMDSARGLIADTVNTPPVVLGVQVSNESIGKVVDVLHGLPAEQQNQIKKLLCEPVATQSAE